MTRIIWKFYDYKVPRFERLLWEATTSRQTGTCEMHLVPSALLTASILSSATLRAGGDMESVVCNTYFSFSITEVLPGDIVFLTSDGISDNFDPVVNLNLILINDTFESQVGKFCVPKKPDRQGSTGSRGARTPGREPLRY